MKKLIFTLILVGIFTTACSKNNEFKNENISEKDLTAQLSDEVHSDKPDKGIEYLYKYEYLKKLDDLQENVDKSDSLYDEESSLKMIEIAEEKFETWNSELNKIYKVIKNQLDSNKYEDFKNQEVTWLKEREKSAEDDAKQFEGMDFAQVQYNSSLAKLTKERCYELVNLYLQ